MPGNVVPLDIRELTILRNAKTRIATMQANTAAAIAFREECKRLTGELAMIMRENIALRRANNAYVERIQLLERGEYRCDP